MAQQFPQPEKGGYPFQPEMNFPPQPENTDYPPHPEKGCYPPQPSDLSQHGGSGTASAPDINLVIPGYEHVPNENGAAFIPPPKYDDIFPGALPPPPQRLTSIFSISPLAEDHIREALEQFLSEHCCYGKKPAREMEFSINPMISCFRYTLETFGEQRKTFRAEVPYRPGDMVDGPYNGVAPQPWDIPVQQSRGYFVEDSTSLTVPHTEVVKTCSECNGIGRKTCSSCLGRGHKTCISCSGCGYSGPDRKTCSSCGGCGSSRCFSCSGLGMKSCLNCDTFGKVKSFIKLSVKWKNHVEECIEEKEAVPHHLIKNVSGTVAFEEQKPRVYPLTNFPDETVNMSSRFLLDKHNNAYRSERILQQRHKVQIVPITEVTYTWKELQGTFHVYGLQNKVYFPTYPRKCCCGCSII